MALHIVKLCVGVDSVADLEAWIAGGRGRGAAHLTRLVPKRADEIAGEAGGSLYWVIKKQIACRQRITAIECFSGSGGKRCRIRLEPTVVPVWPKPCRAFQGWRYLPGHEAPGDAPAGAADVMPEALRRELSSLGLI